MKKNHILSLAIVMSLTLFSCNQSQPEKTPREADPSFELSVLSLAAENARIGYELQDPLLLMSAAKLLIETPASELELVSSDEPPLTDESDKSAVLTSLDAATLLQDALLFAADDSALLVSINNLTAHSVAAARGAVGGPYFILRTVEKLSTNTYMVSFRSGELAEVGIYGDGDTDLDLFVFDKNGNLIASDADNTDKCYVSWVPLWTGEYQILVRNLGPVHNNFILVTN